MNSLKKSPYLFPVVLTFIFIINILQSITTELLADEAYYWTYSTDLSFGYFDHPPMVAAYIWLSGLIFNGELGVRFISALGYILMLFFIWKLIDHPKKKAYTWLFLLLFYSTALLNVYGFLTVPDSPLMLFTALFLWAYKMYLVKKSTVSYVLLSVAMAGMLYSKYQGILIIFFVLLSNIKVLKDPKILLSGLGTVLLFFPHLYWQYIHDFPSIKYHIIQRGDSLATYRLNDTLLHLVNPIAIVGFTFVIIYKAFFNGLKKATIFQRGLNYIVIGFFFFFFIASFKGHVQAQWIVPMVFPLIIITFHYLVENPKWIRMFCVLAALNISAILISRFIIATEGMIPINTKFHGNKEWPMNLKNEVGDVDKLFINNYQNASVYWFYTKEKPHYQNNYLGRKNNYNLIPDNLDFITDSIAHITKVRDPYSAIAIKGQGKDSIFISYIKRLKPVFDLKMDFTDDTIVLNRKPEESVNIHIVNPYSSDIDFSKVTIHIVFQRLRIDEKYSIPASIDIGSIPALGDADASLQFDSSNIASSEEFQRVGIGIRMSEKMDLVKVSTLHKYIIKE